MCKGLSLKYVITGGKKQSKVSKRFLLELNASLNASVRARFSWNYSVWLHLGSLSLSDLKHVLSRHRADLFPVPRTKFYREIAELRAIRIIWPLHSWKAHNFYLIPLGAAGEACLAASRTNQGCSYLWRKLMTWMMTKTQNLWKCLSS